MTRAIGIDVGGTKIAAGIVDVETGAVLRAERMPTRPERGGGAVLADCAGLARRMGSADLPVGVGICELVGLDGRVTSAETVDWRGLDVAAGIPGRLVVVESDVRAAALAEARVGAGAGLESFLYVIVGTGASVCLVLDGRPLRGARGNAIVLGAPPVEAVASGAALARRGNGPEAVADAVAALAQTLAVLVNALDPEAVIVGGGLGLAAGFLDDVAGALRPAVECADTRSLLIAPSALAGDGGIVGAAMIAAGTVA